MKAVRVECPAKVNLFLEIEGRRDDGYHEIRTVLQAIDLSDTLFARPAPGGVSLEVEGADIPAGPENLAFDAAERFLRRFGPPGGVALRLTKRIPARAGLGGGSSDAAGTLLALSRLHPGPGPEELAGIGAEIGSDVPFFLAAATAIGEGRGERIRPLAPPAPRWLVLFHPPFGLSTPEVYAEVRPPAAADRRGPDELVGSLGGDGPWRGLFNRLEPAAATVEPALAEFRRSVEERLRPGEPLLLSGSGSAFFAVVSGAARAAELATAWNRAGGRALAVRTRDRRLRVELLPAREVEP